MILFTIYNCAKFFRESSLLSSPISFVLSMTGFSLFQNLIIFEFDVNPGVFQLFAHNETIGVRF